MLECSLWSQAVFFLLQNTCYLLLKCRINKTELLSAPGLVSNRRNKLSLTEVKCFKSIPLPGHKTSSVVLSVCLKILFLCVVGNRGTLGHALVTQYWTKAWTLEPHDYYFTYKLQCIPLCRAQHLQAIFLCWLPSLSGILNDVHWCIRLLLSAGQQECIHILFWSLLNILSEQSMATCKRLFLFSVQH